MNEESSKTTFVVILKNTALLSTFSVKVYESNEQILYDHIITVNLLEPKI